MFNDKDNATLYIYIYIYTECFILNDIVDYLANDFIEKFFERKLHGLKGDI